MANFFLIDQSLERIGGHHFDYVRCVAQAARDEGFLTTIGVNRRFRNTDGLSRLGRVQPVFRDSTYSHDSYLTGLRQLTRVHDRYLSLYRIHPTGWRQVGALWRRLRHESRRERSIRRFATDCETFFRPFLLSDFDHAFFTTINELEFMGIAAYLATWPTTLQVQWHFQFHFNLFDGRTPEYDSQRHVARVVQNCFDAARARIPYHRIHLYTTSEALADQYNRLGVGDFRVLAYPVRPELFGLGGFDESTETDRIDRIDRIDRVGRGRGAVPESTNSGSATSAATDASPPIQITCPGAVRREKQSVEYLQPLVEQIWQRHIATGNVRLAVQRPRRHWPAREKIELRPPRGVAEVPGWVRYHSHPLPDDDYLKLIADTDCGLLYYDSRAYFSRRAGVLGELLCLGKPVIVPAGSWLGDQIQPAVFEHVCQIARSATVRSLGLDDLQWDSSNVPHMGGQLAFDHGPHPFQFTFPIQTRRDRSGRPEEDGFVIRFDWRWPREHGVYCRILARMLGPRGDVLAEQVQVVGHARQTDAAVAYFPVVAQTASIQIQLTNAFHESTANVDRLAILVCRTGRFQPIGQVGMIAPEVERIGEMIDELVEHFAHYQRTAREFARTWRQDHRPRQTLSHLVHSRPVSTRAA